MLNSTRTWYRSVITSNQPAIHDPTQCQSICNLPTCISKQLNTNARHNNYHLFTEMLSNPIKQYTRGRHVCYRCSPGVCVCAHHRVGEGACQGGAHLVQEPGLPHKLGGKKVPWMYCVASHALSCPAAMKFLGKEDVTELRGSIGSHGRVGLPARVLDAGHVKPRRDGCGIPGAATTFTNKDLQHIFGTAHVQNHSITK